MPQFKIIVTYLYRILGVNETINKYYIKIIYYKKYYKKYIYKKFF